jgi:hypothetical protein
MPTGAGPAAARAAAGSPSACSPWPAPSAPTERSGRTAAPAPAATADGASPAAIPAAVRPSRGGLGPGFGPIVAGTVQSVGLDQLAGLATELTPAGAVPAATAVQPALDAARRLLGTSPTRSGPHVPTRIPVIAPDLDQIIADAVRVAP